MSKYLIKRKEIPSTDTWLAEAKADPSSENTGMYLTHVGIVRKTSRAKVRFNEKDTRPVSGMLFSYNDKKVETAIAGTLKLPGISYVRVWLNEGRLVVGDTIMQVLIGGDIRPNVIDGLQYLVDKIKSECVSEEEIYE